MKQVITRAVFQGGLFVGRHLALELECALSKRLRRGQLTRGEYHRALAEFYAHFPDIFSVVDPLPSFFDTAAEYARATHKRNIGSADFLHLVLAEHVADMLGEIPLFIATSDGGLEWLAKQFNFATLNPETQGIEQFEKAAGTPLFEL